MDQERAEGERKVEMCGVRACKIHRGRAVKQRRGRLPGQKATLSSVIHINTGIERIRISRIQPLSRNIPMDVVFPTDSLSSLVASPSSSAQCDLPELIRHCHANSTRRFEPRGISLTRHAPRLHVRGGPYTPRSPFHPFGIIIAMLIKLISSYVDHSRDDAQQYYSDLVNIVCASYKLDK